MIAENTYRQFLYYPRLYNKLKEEWVRFFLKNFDEDSFEEWISNIDAGGQEIMDGNPIYSAFFKNHCKAIRIIQIGADLHEQSLTMWIDETEWNTTEVSELVVSVKPDKSATLQAQKFIKDFIADNLLPSALELSNLQFEKLFELGNNQQDINKTSVEKLWLGLNDSQCKWNVFVPVLPESKIVGDQPRSLKSENKRYSPLAISLDAARIMFDRQVFENGWLEDTRISFLVCSFERGSLHQAVSIIVSDRIIEIPPNKYSLNLRNYLSQIREETIHIDEEVSPL